MFDRKFRKGQKVLGLHSHRWLPAIITSSLRVYGFSAEEDHFEYVARFHDGRECQVTAVDLKSLSS